MQSYWTYIPASKPRGTLYVGVTNGLPTRVETTPHRHRFSVHAQNIARTC